MPGDMEIKCHSPRPTPGGLQPNTGGRGLGRREGKVSESVIPSVPEAFQEIQVEMLRRQINMGRERKRWAEPEYVHPLCPLAWHV